MKLFKKLAFALVAVAAVFSLASCSKVNEKYAQKINDAVEAGEPYTVEQVQEDLGDEAQSYVVLGTGAIVAVKGVETKEDLEKKLEEEDTVEGLLITCALGKAINATYTEIDLEDLK